MEILVDTKRPFIVGVSVVSKIKVEKINFAGYSECFKQRLAEMSRTGDEMSATKAFMRARRLHQVKAYDAKGDAIALEHLHFSNMSRDLFTKINAALDNNDEPRGDILENTGDGLYTPLIYKLGTPFGYVDTNINEKPIGTEPKIIELEFIAKTGGDIEEVLCHDNSLDQTMALIKTCATPLGGGTSLQRLPSWMLTSLTLADGFQIMRKVLPVFLG